MRNLIKHIRLLYTVRHKSNTDIKLEYAAQNGELTSYVLQGDGMRTDLKIPH